MVKLLTLIPDTLLNYQPPVTKLWYIGQPLGEELKVAIVGTRRPSQEGSAIAYELAGTLARRGITIISGLALGIDSAAHRGALAGDGKTIAVLPGDLERIYPATNVSLAREIIKNSGTLISEFPKAHAPKPYDFLARNRIVAGLASVVVVVEAPKRSGALNTARHAMDMGVDVMAVPGSIKSVNSVGTNYLLKVGCAPLTSVEDVFEVLGLPLQQPIANLLYSDEAKAICSLIKDQTQTPEQIAVALDKPLVEIEQMITELEIDGVIARLSGNLLQLRS